MTMFLRWPSFVVEIVHLQASFGENKDNIHFNFFFFFNIPRLYMKKGCREQVTYTNFIQVLPSLIYKAIQLALKSNT